ADLGRTGVARGVGVVAVVAAAVERGRAIAVGVGAVRDARVGGLVAEGGFAARRRGGHAPVGIGVGIPRSAALRSVAEEPVVAVGLVATGDRCVDWRRSGVGES